MSIFDTADKRVLSKSELGLVIKHLRELRQWSQETLAQLAHTTDRTIQRIEAGSGTSVHTLRALAVAFGFQDIDAFTKPMAIPTDEQLQAACEQFEKDYVVNKAHKPESGRCLAKLAEESVGDYIEPACELSQDQALTFAELTDYLRDYRECAEHYSSTGRKRLANTPPRFFQLAAWCPPVFGGHHFKPLAEDLPCQANAAPIPNLSRPRSSRSVPSPAPRLPAWP
ncbi:helix-turn-helix domain-containing protein [Pseudomonas aeruginosa]|uniref:helix-turn-helix domain-containing protein n=1 Tax=Pseudomonas aeruginosa TaxID=287 RepID=UPI0022EAC5B1|nr:helix-turn-helix transcriptional regulator [Pseudomonas aeruginosa]